MFGRGTLFNTLDISCLFFLFSMDRFSKMDVDLTLYLRLGTGVIGCTPEVHPRACNVGCPGEIDSINVVEGQTAHLSIRIDPVHIAAAGRDKASPDKQEVKGAAVNILKLPGRHGRNRDDRFLISAHNVWLLETNS